MNTIASKSIFLLNSLTHSRASSLLLSRLAHTSGNIYENGILRSEFPDLPLQEVNVANHILENAVKKFKNDTSIECILSQQKSTYEEVWQETKALAAGFVRLGLKQGDVVVVSMANGPLFPKVAFALAYIGVTASLLNPMNTPYEIGRILRSTEAKAVISQNILLPNMMKALDDMPESNIKVFVDNCEAGGDPRILPLSSILSSESDLGFEAPVFDYKNTTAFMLFSSGTTGPPKGVQLSHYGMTSAREIHSDHMDINYLRDGGVLSIIPKFHIYGLMHVTSILMPLGVKIMTLPIFDYDLFLHTLKEKRPAGVTLVPPLAVRMAADPNCTKDHLASLKFASCAGAPISPLVVEAFKAKAPADLQLWMGYALTECPSIAKHVNCVEGSTGKIVANVKAKFIDVETGEDVQPGQKGEICVKAPHVMQGYFKNPSATAEMFSPDGWMLTGDVGFHDQDGNIYIVDRKKDLIKHKGFQVSPSELEDVILQVPGVQEVCVIGVADEKYGEVPKAFIVVREGQSLRESQVHEMVNERLSSYKRLRGGVQFVGALPTNPGGKVLRRALRS